MWCTRDKGQGISTEEDFLKRYQNNNVFSFFDDDLVGVQNAYNDAIIISVTIGNYDVWRILIDNESSVDVLFYDTLIQMNISYDRLRRLSSLLYGFNGNPVGIERKN